MHTSITPEIEAAWRRGHKVEAIKLLRDATGWGLAETKHALEAALDGAGSGSGSGTGARAAPHLATHTNLPAAINAALANGDKLAAVKLLKDATGIGLKEAKDRIESGDPSQWMASPAAYPPAHPAPSPSPTVARATPTAAPPAWSQPGFEPGKVETSFNGKRALIVLLLAAIVAGWYFWRP